MANNKIEDIFDEVDKTSNPKKTASNIVASKVKTPPVQPQKAVPKSSLPQPGKSRVPIIVMLVFVFLVLAGLVYLVITGIFIDKVEEGTSIVVNTVTNVVEEVVGNTNTSESSANDTNDIFVNVEKNSGPLDSDGDGLTDEEESTLGTSISSNDTDHDGLFDREEVKVYKTNPLKSDSDGDGKLDGTEVDNGFDPNGPGLLLDLKSSIDNL